MKDKCPDFDLPDSFLNDREGDENTTSGFQTPVVLIQLSTIEETPYIICVMQLQAVLLVELVGGGSYCGKLSYLQLLTGWLGTLVTLL